MGEPIRSQEWTGDVGGRARTKAPLFTSEAYSEIRRVLALGLVLGTALVAALLTYVMIYQGTW